MSSREPGKHPYARAYEKSAGQRAERAFVPPFRAPAEAKAEEPPEVELDNPDPHDDPDTPRQRTDEPVRGLGISRAALVLVALALGMGLLIGRVSVNTTPSQVVTPTAAKTTPIAAPLGPTSLQETGARCSQQSGSNLILGVEVRNVDTSPVHLQQLKVNLPSGLTLKSTGVGACGEIEVPLLKDFGLPTQGTVWLSATVQVARPCPAALAVSETIYVTDDTGRVQPIKIAGFANLKQVPWSGCTTRSTATTSSKATTSVTKSSGKKSPAAKSSAKKSTKTAGSRSRKKKSAKR